MSPHPNSRNEVDSVSQCNRSVQICVLLFISACSGYCQRANCTEEGGNNTTWTFWGQRKEGNDIFYPCLCSVLSWINMSCLHLYCLYSYWWLVSSRTISVSSLPYWSAHEGVFLSRFHIKEYLSWFRSPVELGTQQSSATSAATSRKYKRVLCSFFSVLS